MKTGGRRHPVLLHGFTGSSASWEGVVIDGLAGVGPPPVLVDLPGHGRHAGETDRAAFTLETALEGIGRAVGDRADLIGYSMGGRLALHFAAAFPERVGRLVLESASPGLADDAELAARRSADQALARRLVDDDLEAFVEYWEALPLFESRRSLPATVLERQRGLRRSNHAGSLAAALHGLGTGALPSLWDRLTEIETPTLVIAGELDRKFVEICERMAGALPDATMVVVPDAGHTVHLERPGAWLSAVAEFLAT